MTTRYRLARPARDVVARLTTTLGIPTFVASVLAARGISTPEEAHRFMEPSLEDWRSPYEIEGMENVISRLKQALERKEHILVFGDFDLDGISATTVLTRGLRALGAQATPFIPKRFEEGYGITKAAIERALTYEPDLIITVDCGIACGPEVAFLREQGIPVIITDHHEGGDAIPQGVPLIDPKLDPACPSSILAGVGVALKVVQALGSACGYPHLWRTFTDLATLGTVADLMPMIGENRALVSDGLAHMNADPRPCIKALMDVSGATGRDLTSTNLSFTLVPRLNAAGRMGDAELALDLLLSEDYESAFALATKLEEVNTLRRTKEAELSEIAYEQAASTYKGERCLLVAGQGWHEGVKGIVASRLTNIYKVPTILFTIDGDEARGSGRSIGEVNLFRAIEESSRDLLTKFGGHSAAVGVTLPAANLDAFRKRLDAYMATLPESAFQSVQVIDASVALSELTMENVQLLNKLAPYGQENPEPCLTARNVLIERAKVVGADKNHFSCRLTDGRYTIDGILFHCENIDHLIENEAIVDAVFRAEVDEWRGRKSVKAMLSALIPAKPCTGIIGSLSEVARDMFDKLFVEPDAERCVTREAPYADRPFDDPTSAAQSSRGASHASTRAEWERVASQDPLALAQAVIRAIIGEGHPHEAQSEMLKMLHEGRSTLGIMATGRGKSLVFQTFAALLALTSHKASIFVYPLRALMADQAFHLSSQLSRFGIVCEVLNGESTQSERERIYSSLAAGKVDIILTTPEYLSFHAERIAACGRIGFMVVDEAHHIGQARAGVRMSYRELKRIVHILGDPVVLAVTATASTDIASDISSTLPIDVSVIDDTQRDNLFLDDVRNIRNKDDYLAHLVASGEKCVIYVNSREQSVSIARRLRARVPQLAPMIGFYNAGLSREERACIEDLFRKGDIAVLVTTSAFGEGVDIPDIRHVVLYHMPFSDIEFNQMAGRAGRDGREAWVHLLFGQQDVRMNEGILNDMTPERDVMVRIYRALKGMQASCPGCAFTRTIDDLAQAASQGSIPITPTAAACGLAVFRELGLIDAAQLFEGGAEVHSILVHEDCCKVELTDSVRYCEGRDELDHFYAFRDWAMRCDIEGLRRRITHPIIPNQGL